MFLEDGRHICGCVCGPHVLHSDPTPTFSLSIPSTSTPTYKVLDTWDCLTVVSDFPNVIPAHPFDNLPCLAPEPFSLGSLLRSWPYTSHCFTDFCPLCSDGDPTELWLAPHLYLTQTHTLEHSSFCYEHICPTHSPYGGNR